MFDAYTKRFMLIYLLFVLAIPAIQMVINASGINYQIPGFMLIFLVVIAATSAAQKYVRENEDVTSKQQWRYAMIWSSIAIVIAAVFSALMLFTQGEIAAFQEQAGADFMAVVIAILIVGVAVWALQVLLIRLNFWSSLRAYQRQAKK